MYQNNFWISVQEKSNLLSIIPRNHPIIPEYSPILFTTHYSQNYPGIIDACLTNTPKLSESKYQAGFGVIILGQNPLTFMIPTYSTTVLYDYRAVTTPSKVKLYQLTL